MSVSRCLILVWMILVGTTALTQPPTPAPDVNGDGVVDQEDLLVIQQYWQSGEKCITTPEINKSA